MYFLKYALINTFSIYGIVLSSQQLVLIDNSMIRLFVPSDVITVDYIPRLNINGLTVVKNSIIVFV